MLLETIAAVILAGMMLVPILNLIVGMIVGGGLAGVSGCLLGLALALLITVVERLLAARFFDGARQPNGAKATAHAPAAARSRLSMRLRRRVRLAALGPRALRAGRQAGATLH